MVVGARRRRRGGDPPERRRSMTDLAVLGQDPGFRGGALAMTESFWRAAEALGRRPELHYVRVRSLDAQRDSGSVVRGRGVPQLLRGFDAVNVAGAAAAIAPRLRAARTRLVCAAVASNGLAAVPPRPPSGLDAHVPLDDDEWRARLDRPEIVFVGRASDPRKNIGLLLDAFTLLRTRLSREVRLTLVGDSPLVPLPSGAHATGHVDSVAERIRGAALFVLPSRQEGFGIGVAEALAAGGPGLVT